jgi:amino acid adenylation domain-containing protein
LNQDTDYQAVGFVPFELAETEQSLPSRFEQQAARHATGLAIQTGQRVRTYQQLNDTANRIAHVILQERDIAGERVALLLNTDAGMLAAILAVLKAGKAYVPLDPWSPRLRSTYILEDSQASLLITDNKNLAQAEELLGQSAVGLLNLDDGQAEGPAGNPERLTDPDAPAWIYYTSGSTGKPKGVVQTHRNVLHYVMNYTNAFRLTAKDCWALLFSFSVNAGAHGAFATLLNGACICPYAIRQQGLVSLAPWLAQTQATVYSSVPTVFRHFAATLVGEELFPPLRIMLMMGEPLYRRDVDLFQRHFSAGCTLVNRLGSTETGSILWNFISMEEPCSQENIPVGHPVAGNEILILDDADQTVEPGETGEIVVRSRYLSPGYWRKPEQTTAAFWNDPEDNQVRFYRMGDLGRLSPDGSIVCLGRKDSQIKIRGYRIETSEVEAALLSHAGIEEAVAWTWVDGAGANRLVAYFVPRANEMLTVSELRRHLASVLPDYMMPSFFVPMESLPQAPNGKVDRRALPPPPESRPPLDLAYLAPRTEVEQTLADIWSDVLGVSPVGVQDDFLELGGDSLLATQIAARMRGAFQVELPLPILFQASTVAALARAIEQASETGGSAVHPRIAPSARRAQRAGGLSAGGPGLPGSEDRQRSE